MYSGAYYQAGNKDGEWRKTQLRRWRTLWICQYWDWWTKSDLFVWYLGCTHFNLSVSEQSNSSINLFGAWAGKMKGNTEQTMMIMMKVSVFSISYKRDQHKYSSFCLFSDTFNSCLIYCRMQYPNIGVVSRTNKIFFWLEETGLQRFGRLVSWTCQSNITIN